jgi:hypothetical protein
MTVDRSALFRIERSWNDHALAQRLAPADEDPTDQKWLGEQPELRVDEAQGAMDRCVRNGGPSKDQADILHLLLDALDKLCAVTTPDHEPDVGAKPSALVDLGDEAGIALGVDYPYPAGGDDEVIDVGGCPWAPSVMEDEQAVARQCIEGDTELLLADSSLEVGGASVVGSVDGVREPPEDGSAFDTLATSVVLLRS